MAISKKQGFEDVPGRVSIRRVTQLTTVSGVTKFRFSVMYNGILFRINSDHGCVCLQLLDSCLCSARAQRKLIEAC